MNKNKIKPIRQKIDDLDHQILKLIQKRGSLAQKIGHLKSLVNANASFYKPEREAEVYKKYFKASRWPNF